MHDHVEGAGELETSVPPDVIDKTAPEAVEGVELSEAQLGLRAVAVQHRLREFDSTPSDVVKAAIERARHHLHVMSVGQAEKDRQLRAQSIVQRGLGRPQRRGW